MRFSRSRANIVCSPRSSSPGWSRTGHHRAAVVGRRRIRSPCFRYNTGPRSSREAGSRTRMCVLPRHVGCRYPTSRWIFQVRTAGLEPAISWPPTRRSSRSPTLCCASSPSGSRTPAAADHRCAAVPEGRHPQPLDERAASGSGGARILVSWFSARC